MGQKTHPTGFRLGGVIDWQSQWYANNGKNYSLLLNEDRNIREIITTTNAGTVIHSPNNLAEVLVSLSLGTMNLKKPF